MIKNYVIEQLQSPKVGAIVAAATVGNGTIASILDVIPDNIMKLSTLIGMLVAIIVAFCHISGESRARKKARIENEKDKIELEKSRLELEKLELENKSLRSKK